MDQTTGESRARGAPRVALTHVGGDATAPVANALAVELKLPVVGQSAGSFDLLLVVRDDRLELRETKPRAPGPVYADFIGGRPGSYRRRVGSRRQPLARAVGLTDGTPHVLDATAGLGRDTFRLAMLGCRVTAMERSPIVGALLRDGLHRARAVPEIDAVFDERFRFVPGDSREVLAGLGEADRPDVVYLDPMYPAAKGASALAKKEMRMFRLLVGDDEDADQLFDAARRAARDRVVVKRPDHAPPLGAKPHFSCSGKIARYDVYLVR